MPKTAIILFAHGSRDPSWAEPLQQIRASILAMAPDSDVRLAFLEFMEPTLETAIVALAADAIERVTLIPLFVSPGKHVKSDLTQLLEESKSKHPQMRITVGSSIGDSEDMREILAEWAYRTHRNACRI
jgi:sirohydrochlorin cobaltochelatase